MQRIRRYRASIVVALTLVGLMLVSTLSAGAAPGLGRSGFGGSVAAGGSTGPELTAALATDGAPGSIAVSGRYFTPGGRVYVALYDVWGATLYETRWTDAAASNFGPNGSQDPAVGYVAG